MESAPLDFLLSEAKDRYKSEHDKFGQIYSRAGIYLGVLAIYANLLIRFLDRPPPSCGSWVETVFRYAIVALILAIVASAFCVVGAILGRPFAYVPEPSSWVEFVDRSLRSFIRSRGPLSDDGAELAEEVRRQTLERYSSAIDHNIAVNRRVAGWLHFASYCVLGGLLIGVIGTAAYAWLAFSVRAAVLSPVP